MSKRGFSFGSLCLTCGFSGRGVKFNAHDCDAFRAFTEAERRSAREAVVAADEVAYQRWKRQKGIP